jgi:hypothetical protein
VNATGSRAKHNTFDYGGRITTWRGGWCLATSTSPLGVTSLLYHTGRLYSGAPSVLQLSWAAGLLLLLVVVE